ncbi:adenosylcobinamide-GDP ribazoletransferase [Dictyobacter arantiisoli]|uniref:Adenosylcobinamide-GDP ribazoletransferase n=1 Tax=Dictyobacter arantiisoli TaxID=2014874 RepID=A0A5A5TGC9_9CHLR|nr:adenosylcobinamide-GDP ribazoletransferase [Dictyobacter arantiisoli]GCF10123.1 adenosylcobinamide-GDP ribazoletransferase [Dictyobacter arantiisoli]
MSETTPLHSNPEHPSPSPVGPTPDAWLMAQWKEFVAALKFLTTLPVPGATQLFTTGTADATLFVGSAYFPLVGLLLALILWLVVLIFGAQVSSLVLAALLVVALVILTGGLHLDGLMDCCDGLFGGTSRERKLEIMRDSRVGSFGVLGGVCLLFLKFALLASLDRYHLPFALLAILPISRWNMVLAMYAFPGARPSGLGEAYRRTVTRKRLICAAVLSLLIALLSGPILVGLLLWICGTLVAWITGEWITHVLGGLTGDVYGALAEFSEVVLLLLFTLLHVWL